MTDEKIVKRAKEAEKRTGFGELVHSPISKGVNSAYGIGFIEGMVEYRNSLQEEPVSEDKMTISKEWFEHCKKSWYNEGYLDGEYNRDRQFAKNNSITLADLGEFIIELSKQFPEVSFAKVCKIATRTAKWQKKQMMAKAINTKASLIMSVPSICISLPLGVNVGDKVKVIVIKED